LDREKSQAPELNPVYAPRGKWTRAHYAPLLVNVIENISPSCSAADALARFRERNERFFQGRVQDRRVMAFAARSPRNTPIGKPCVVLGRLAY